MHEPEIPTSLRFSAELATRWSDGDVQGVLNNAVYSTLLEEGRYAYFDALGLLERGHFPFLLAQSSLRFLAPGRGGCRVRIELSTTRLGRSSFEQAYRIREAGRGAGETDGTIWCEAQARLVCYEPESGRPRPMDPEFRSRIEAFEGQPSVS
jgi:acyl-CoA thioester hydrolase